MTATADIPTFVVEQDDEAIEEPIPFRLQYVDGDGETQTVDLLALGNIPYGWVLDFWNASVGGLQGQAIAMVEFFDRVIVPEDREKFLGVVYDPVLKVDKRLLNEIAIYLLRRYEMLVDPTRARSAGRAASRSGSRSTGNGRSGKRTAKAST